VFQCYSGNFYVDGCDTERFGDRDQPDIDNEMALEVFI
jgi:hypothetical protein